MTDDGRWFGLGAVVAAVAVSMLELRRPTPEWAYQGPGSKVRTTLIAPPPSYTLKLQARLELVDEDTNTSKYWELHRRSDGKADIHWGRIGTKGQWQSGISMAEADKRYHEKLRNGYEIV